MQVYPLIIHLSVGQPIVLSKVQVKESKLEFNDVEGQAPESTVQQVAGDGQRKPHWKEFDVWLNSADRPSLRAARLADFEDSLRYAVRAEIDGLSYFIDRIRVVGRQPVGQGYRLTLRMIGPHHDFIDAADNFRPLW